MQKFKTKLPQTKISNVTSQTYLDQIKSIPGGQCWVILENIIEICHVYILKRIVTLLAYML